MKGKKRLLVGKDVEDTERAEGKTQGRTGEDRMENMGEHSREQNGGQRRGHRGTQEEDRRMRKKR